MNQDAKLVLHPATRPTRRQAQVRVHNCHERVMSLPHGQVAARIACFDAIWPTQVVPMPRSLGGRLYDVPPMVWEEFERPGAIRAFRVILPEGLAVEHWFEAQPVDDGTLVRHTVEGEAVGECEKIWREGIEPYHNRVLEALLDNIEAPAA